jgi:uncharacterized protein (DUF58 family)
MSGGFERGLLAVAAGLGAVLGLATGVHALLLFSAALLLTLGLAAVQARRRLRGLRAGRHAAASAFEGEEARVEIAVENRGRAAVTLVGITDSFGAALADRHALLDPGPLLPGRRHRLAYRAICSRLWGVYALGPLTLSVSDSLGLFTVRRLTTGDIRPFDLFPRVHPVRGLEHLGSRTSFAPSSHTAARAGQSVAYLGVRDFRPGDEVRRMHWPATARVGTPMVKELELDLLPHFTLFLDLARRHRAGTGRKSTLEYVVRTATSLLATACRQGDAFQLFADGGWPLVVPSGRGDLHLAFALDQLIRVKQEGQVDLLDLVDRELASVLPGSTVALLAASAFLDPDRLAATLAAFRSRRVRPILVAMDEDSFLPIDKRPRPRDEVAARVAALADTCRGLGALLAVLGAEDALAESLERPGWLEVA